MASSHPRPQARWDNRRFVEVGVLLAELKVCSGTRNLDRGKQIHARIVATGNDSCIHAATALVRMYACCGSMLEARQVFDSIKLPDVVAWTALISGYAENGEGFTALSLFSRMKSQECIPDSFTFVAALKACISLTLELEETGIAECLKWGKQIHSNVGFMSNVYVQSTLIDMYTKCGSMVEARQVFDSMKEPNVVSWGALILGYAENGEGITALNLFAKMRIRGCAPNSFTFVAALKACTSLAVNQDGRAECLERGMQLHAEIGLLSDVYVQSTLVDMYVKCGKMLEARQVFNSIEKPNVVSWTALILGYADNGEAVTALDLYARMKSKGCSPNSFTFVAALKACGVLGALESGSKIDAEIGPACRCNTILVTSLVDFYSKCGNLARAQQVFDSQPKARDMKTWTALLAGYSRLGDSKAALRLFKEMQDAGFQPNRITFLCVLTSCNHAGLADTASDLFEAMSTHYGITPIVEHYSCMIDVLGRSNKIDEAAAFLRSMPCRANAVTWKAVLSACRKWKNVGVGRLAFRSLVSLDDTDAACYVQIANIYGSRGMREEQEMVWRMRRRIKQAPEVSEQSWWTSSLGEVHAFVEIFAAQGSR